MRKVSIQPWNASLEQINDMECSIIGMYPYASGEEWTGDSWIVCAAEGQEKNFHIEIAEFIEIYGHCSLVTYLPVEEG